VSRVATVLDCWATAEGVELLNFNSFLSLCEMAPARDRVDLDMRHANNEKASSYIR
jgi:hypothetical protein